MTTYVSIADTDPVGSCRTRIRIECLPIWVRIHLTEFEAKLNLFPEYLTERIESIEKSDPDLDGYQYDAYPQHWLLGCNFSRRIPI